MPKQRANMVYAGFAARQLPKIKITKEQADKIRGVVNGALIKRGKPKLGNSLADLLDHDPVTVVKQAVEHLVSEKVYSVPVAEFRAMVRKRRPSDLRKTLERLAKLLPETDAFPPWWQMRAAFTGAIHLPLIWGTMAIATRKTNGKANMPPTYYRPLCGNTSI